MPRQNERLARLAQMPLPAPTGTSDTDARPKAQLFGLYQLQMLAALLGCGIVLFHVVCAWRGKPFYRDIHLFTALHYAQGKIDLLRPIIVGFNATETPTPQELPVWQATVGGAIKILGPWWGWANIVSLVFFATCLFPLYHLAKSCGGPRVGWWTLVFFLAEPLIFLYAGLASTDGFSLAATIWFLFFAVRLLRHPSAWGWVLTALAGALAAVSKLPFFLATGLAVAFLTVTTYRTSLKRWILMGTAAAFVGIIFAAWTHYTNSCLKQAEFPLVNLNASSREMMEWYFGGWHYRLSPGPWVKGAWRILHACSGSFALAIVPLIALCFPRPQALGRIWFAGAVCTTLVFTHLVLHHWHYYLMFCPAVALLCAQTTVSWEQHSRLTGAGNQWLALALVLTALVLAVIQGLVGMKLVLEQDPFKGQMAQVIAQNSAESDKIIIAGGSWGGEELFRAHRQGLSVWKADFLDNPAQYHRLKELGFTRLVLLSESPLFAAVQLTNPGESSRKRETYQRLVTPSVEQLPTLFQSDDVLIKALP